MPAITFAPPAGPTVADHVAITAECGTLASSLQVFVRRVDVPSALALTDDVALGDSGQASYAVDLTTLQPGSYGVLAACASSGGADDAAITLGAAAFYTIGEAVPLVPVVNWFYGGTADALTVVIDASRCLPVGPGSTAVVASWRSDDPESVVPVDSTGWALVSRPLDGSLDATGRCVELLGDVRVELASVATGAVPNVDTPGYGSTTPDPTAALSSGAGLLDGQAIVLHESVDRGSIYAPIPRRPVSRLAFSGFDARLAVAGIVLVLSGVGLLRLARRMRSAM